MESAWLIALVPLFVAMNAFFVAIEFALVTIRWTRVEALVEANVPGAKLVQRAVENLNDSLAASQLGITFTSLALGWVGEPALAHLFEPLFHGLPPVQGYVLNHVLAVAMAFLCITYLHIVLGELVPRAIAIQHAERATLLLAGPLLAFRGLTRPLVMIMKGSGNRVIQWLRVPEPPAEQQVHSVDELDMLVEEGEEAGVIPTYQASYVRNVFELSDKTVADVMVPREKVASVAITATEDEILETSRETAHTRMPVWEGDPDNIVGVVNTKDLFHIFSLRGLVILMDAMYPATFVTPEMPVARVLATFRREKRQMAVVRDHDGRFLGIVTLEDILEEIVGEIEDEHD
ncbi:MAG: HlyC/CorC family transporter [Candidatus Eisenbacteria bacterium]|uniref:HlyC/CorC family transporter n=1 Tax=Eiseniibacteriota bacterium TaxID=2212470 RepID=A0A933W9K4_UNCEI|nr:HlyC/CorC family transporter [Candidatus Eisenbacteria bacterium]